MCNLGDQIDDAKVVKVPRAKPKVGFRWCSVEGDGSLRPWNFTEATCWMQPVAKADRAPTVDSYNNETGLYIFRDRKTATGSNPGPGHVLCRVEFWGNTVEHDLGHRAQFARITSMALHPSVRRTSQAAERACIRIRKGNPKLKIRFVSYRVK